VLNAEAELYNARGDALNGQVAVTADEIRVLAGVGTLVSALGVASPGVEK